MFGSFAVKPRISIVPEFHPINSRKLLKRAHKAHVWDMTRDQARAKFTEYEVAWLRAHYIVSTSSERRAMRRDGKVWPMPRLLTD